MHALHGVQDLAGAMVVLPQLGSELAWQAKAGHFATQLTGPILGKVTVPMTIDLT